MEASTLKPGPKVPFAEASAVFGKITIGASGAVTDFNGYGITSVTKHVSTDGHYTIQLKKPHKHLVGATAFQLAASAADITFQLLSEDVDNPTASSRTIVLQCKTAGSAANPASGSEIFVHFTFCNSILGFGPTT